MGRANGISATVIDSGCSSSLSERHCFAKKSPTWDHSRGENARPRPTYWQKSAWNWGGSFHSDKLLGAVELWAAIPAGLTLQLHPVAVGVAAAIGAIVGAVAVVVLGERVRSWLLRRHQGNKGDKQHRVIYRVWDRYGVVGLGLLAPLLTGALLGAALGLAFGVPAKRLLLWMGIGIVLWSTVLTAVGALGVAGIKTLGH